MAIVWNRDTVSIVVLPDETLLDSITPIIEEWTKEGLLGRFFLVLPSQVIEREFEPPVINASVWVEQDGDFQLKSLDAFEQLAQQEFKVVRLIALRILQKGSSCDKKQNEALNSISNAVAKSLPMLNARMNETEQVTRFLRLNLIVAPTEVHATSNPEAFGGEWDMHVIASPEDRSTPWTADAMVRNDQRFLRFALMHMASTGGLWNGLGVSPFELVSREKARLGAKWVSRVFVNAILTDGLARRVSAQVLNEISNATRDIYDARIAINVDGTEIIPPEQVDQYVDWMVSQVFVLDNGVLSFSDPDATEKPGKLRLLEWEQIKHFLIFSWDKLKVIPWWIYIWVRRLIGRKLTQTFQTSEGLAQVGIEQEDPMDLRDRQVVDSLFNILEKAKEASDAMSAKSSGKIAKPNPKLWTDIRRIVFGMLDGSELSEFGIKENEGRVPVFSNTSQVVSDPSDKFTVPLEMKASLPIREISWSNMDKVEELNSIIGTHSENLNKKKSALENELDQLARSISVIESKGEI